MFTTLADFTADRFTSTTWEPARKKARFAKSFLKFVLADFPRRQFTRAFYHRLSQTFGHTPYLDRLDFFATFFTSPEGKVRFLRQTLQWPGYGDPAFTYSDVERATQSWLVQNDVLAKYERRLAREPEADRQAPGEVRAGPPASDSRTDSPLLDEIKTAYQVHRLRPILWCCYRAGKRYAVACPFVALAIHRGVVDRSDPTIAKNAADNPVVQWATLTFGKAWAWGLVDGFDRQTERMDTPEYRQGYQLGVALAQEILPGP